MRQGVEAEAKKVKSQNEGERSTQRCVPESFPAEAGRDCRIEPTRLVKIGGARKLRHERKRSKFFLFSIPRSDHSRHGSTHRQKERRKSEEKERENEKKEERGGALIEIDGWMCVLYHGFATALPWKLTRG